ncbi:MAG TPA: hypothetical protein VES67_19840 [Vicinamibacterales bacterium]|nr:hypothetical protein [Vicinamibacterales bacterium]
MHRTLALTAIVAVALAVPAYAQKKDFSGTWSIDQAATDAANTPARSAGGRLVSSPTGFPMTIKQTADSLVIERRGGDGGATNTTTYKLDGVEREVRIGQGNAKAKARWDGDKIVIETVRAGQDGTPVTTIATYAIDLNGVLWVETKAPQGTSKRAYKRS